MVCGSRKNIFNKINKKDKSSNINKIKSKKIIVKENAKRKAERTKKIKIKKFSNIK